MLRLPWLFEPIEPPTNGWRQRFNISAIPMQPVSVWAIGSDRLSRAARSSKIESQKQRYFESPQQKIRQAAVFIEKNGARDGTRTRGLRRDRAAL
jgi:hypothetical protein